MAPQGCIRIIRLDIKGNYYPLHIILNFAFKADKNQLENVVLSEVNFPKAVINL